MKRKLDGWTRRVFNNLLGRLCRAGLTKGSRFLDFGCGEGLFLNYLKEQGFLDVNGFDTFSKAYGCKAVLRKRYDFILAQDVLEHVEAPLDNLSLWHRLLEPGGQLYIGTPNGAALDLEQANQFIHSLHQPYHIHIFSPKALNLLASKAGFEFQRVYDRSYCDTLWPGVNFTFLLHYLQAHDNTLDAGFEKPRPGTFLRNPSLLFWAFAGWFFPTRTECSMVFKAL